MGGVLPRTLSSSGLKNLESAQLVVQFPLAGPTLSPESPSLPSLSGLPPLLDGLS